MNKFYASILVKNQNNKNALAIANANKRLKIKKLLIQNKSIYYYKRVKDNKSEESTKEDKYVRRILKIRDLK